MVHARSSVLYCGTTPMDCLANAASATASTPAIMTVPALGSARVVQMEIVVVLPAPFGPSNPKIAPASTFRSMPSTAVTAVLPP